MIRINLLGEKTKKKQSKVQAPSAMRLDLAGGSKNLLFGGILLLGLVVAVGWSWAVSSELKRWDEKLRAADAELERLKPIREKADRYEKRKELLERKINLITDLKKRQEVPVHILDQVSKNLPDFLWLSKMTAEKNLVSISGKATTYNAVSNFYRNLADSGFFVEVTLGRTFEVPEGVSFSLTASFSADSVRGEGQLVTMERPS